MDWAADGDLRQLASALPFARRRESGPEQVVARLFEEHRDSLFRYVLFLTRNPSISEELVQDAFLKLHLEIVNGKAIENYRAWLFRVSCNLALDYSKSSTAEPFSDREMFASSDDDPEKELLIKESESRLLDAIRSLPAIQRHCLLLRSEGLRYREICNVLAIGETTVVDHIRRAVQRLKKVMRA